MELLGILGSKQRLKILKLLSQKDRYVSEIMKLAGIDGKKANHHLKKLKEANIIQGYKKGRRKYYSLQKEIRLRISKPPKGQFLAYMTK